MGIRSMGSKPGEEGYDCTETAVTFTCVALLHLPIFGINQLIRPDLSCASNYNESIKHQMLNIASKNILVSSCSRISAFSNMHMSLANF